MSSRIPVSPGGVTPYRADDDRRRDDARVGAMQSQLDEARQALRELASRQVRLEETVKQYEGAGAQNRLLLDQMRQEAQQTAQARAIDENRTRQQVGDMEQRLDDAVRPVRSLQAHVAELLEASRKKVDDRGQNERRFEELKTAIEAVQATGDRSGVVAHQVRDSADALRAELDQVRRDILRNEDAVKIIDQETRRRIVEVAQSGDQVTVRIDDLRSDVAHALDMIEETQRSIVHVNPSLEELRGIDGGMKTEIARVHQQSLERHETVIDRLDDVRQALDGQIAEVRQAHDQRVERLNERIDEMNESYRELGLRIGAVAHQLDELRLVDEGLRRDLWHLHEQRVRLRLEQAQHELDQVTGMRRSVNVEPAPEAPVANRPADR